MAPRRPSANAGSRPPPVADLAHAGREASDCSADHPTDDTPHHASDNTSDSTSDNTSDSTPDHATGKTYGEKSDHAPSLAAEYAARLFRACGLEFEPIARSLELAPALEWARSGAMALTGESDGAPRFANGPVATAARGAGLVLASLAADSPLALLDAPALLGERAAIAGHSRAGRVSAGGSARLLETTSGTIVLNLPRRDDWSLVPAWLECETLHAGAESWLTIASLLSKRDGRTVTERGQMIGLAVAQQPTRIEPGRSPFRLESRTEVAAGCLARPLRLLDLSSLWAGPLATSLLAIAGIEVLKIESPARPDGARDGPADFFDLMNGNKEGCALDLTSSGDRADFERLLDAADIVFESSRPRALEQLGYDAASWALDQPGRLWVSITGHGRRAPERDWIAFGDDAAIAAGLIGSPPTRDRSIAEELPSFCADAIADPLAGLHAAAATLGHLRAGRGGVLEISLADVCRFAGGFPAGPLTVPISRTPDEHWIVEVGEESAPIAAPRARDVLDAAPILAPPSHALLSRWTAGC